MTERDPTLADVARAAGVHKATASRALNPATRDRVNPRTAKRIVAEARRLGYVPNTLARGLRTKRTSAVGVLIPDLTNPLFPPIVRGIEDRLAADGYTSLLANTDNDDDRERAQLAALEGRRAEGFIIATARLDHPLLTALAHRGVPLVLVNRCTEGPEVPAVLGDDMAGVRQAVAHLVALGHRRIAHLAGPQQLSTGLYRMQAFHQAMDAAGLPVLPGSVVICSAYSEAAGRYACIDLLAHAPETTAIVAGNDLIALGAIATLAEHGISCPGGMSVVGYNDMPFVDKLRIPLTTVRIPHYELGVQAARLLIERLRDPNMVATKLLLPARLVLRESAGFPRDT